MWRNIYQYRIYDRDKFVNHVYTDVAHVSAATIGMIIAISQIFNGASDICAGFIVDRTRSKYGRARVWMLRMSGPYAIAAILLMTVPQIAPMAQAIYVFITYNLMLTVVYTLFQLHLQQQ